MKTMLAIAALMCVLGAVMLLVDVGAPALWFGVIAVGIALVAVSLLRRGPSAPG